jgi:hypothetical protein
LNYKYLLNLNKIKNHQSWEIINNLRISSAVIKMDTEEYENNVRAPL